METVRISKSEPGRIYQVSPNFNEFVKIQADIPNKVPSNQKLCSAGTVDYK
jgi:hypothetical protein